jgi:hypothetical protein
MDLFKQLTKDKKAIVKKWFDQLMDTYPADTAQFFRSQKDAFANPVGQNSLRSLNELFDLIVENFDPKKAQPIIDPIIRIRAIQNFTPTDAVRFVFNLKDIIHHMIPHAADDKNWRTLDKRIDDLGLTAFDVYMHCREKIYELKANETQKRIFSAFDRAGLIKEPDDN